MPAYARMLKGCGKDNIEIDMAPSRRRAAPEPRLRSVLKRTRDKTVRTFGLDDVVGHAQRHRGETVVPGMNEGIEGRRIARLAGGYPEAMVAEVHRGHRATHRRRAVHGDAANVDHRAARR